MRAITLWQPWASAVALRSKRIETRHWSTDYRGPLAIHAAKRWKIRELRDLAFQECWRGALYPLWVNEELGMDFPMFFEDCLPFGALVATVQLVDCRPTESFKNSELHEQRTAGAPPFKQFWWTENQMGDFTPGRFGWVFEDIKPLPIPIPYVGSQRWFNVPDELLKEAA